MGTSCISNSLQSPAHKVPKVLSKEDKSYFEHTNYEFFKRFKALQESAVAMETYYKNEDYKDDDFPKGMAWADSIENN